ncbi:unnamed protein product [Gongylonema pulchrum]|uniref:Transposase n=1 Tax=Gongylonema pulchrum TaxID=637853 RepID=A0A183D2A0_9BILA|nr:unnamed protein product [Gongylonema pulchrum]
MSDTKELRHLLPTDTTLHKGMQGRLFNNIVLCGGNVLFDGFRKRVLVFPVNYLVLPDSYRVSLQCHLCLAVQVPGTLTG